MRTDGACFIKTDVPAKIVKEGIMKTPNMYWCSESVIQETKKVQTPSSRNYFGYGICTEKDGYLNETLTTFTTSCFSFTFF